MRFFNKPTVGSRMLGGDVPPASDEQRLQLRIDNHGVMKKDNIGRIFAAFTRAEEAALAEIIREQK